MRYFLLLFLALTVYFLPSSSAFAATEPGCTPQSGSYFCSDREAAYNQAMSVPVSTCGFVASMCLYLVAPNHNLIPQPDTYKGRYVPKWLVDFGRDGQLPRLATTDIYYLSECPAPLVWNDETHKCEGDKDCSLEPDLPKGGFITGDDLSVCSGGCKFSGASSFCLAVGIDNVKNWYCDSWKSTGEKCAAGSSDTPPSPNDSDGDGSSDGNDSSPNNPGSGNPNQPQDGGGKGNGNGSGEGSGNGNTSGGGGSCSSPPASTGDAILAQIAYQTWATRCAIEGAKDGNGNLKTSNGSASGGGEGEGEGTNFGSSAPPADEPFDASEHQRFGIGLNSSMLDSEAIFGAGNCPVFTITIYQSTFSTSELPAWCDLLRVMRALVLLFGAFTALRILMGNNS